METGIQAGVQVTLLQIVGPVVALVSLVALLAILTLAGLGVRARITGADVAGASWWLGTCSRFLLIFGLLSFAWYLTTAFSKIGMGAMGRPELIVDDLGEAFARLALPVSVALLGHVGIMLVGRPSRKVQGESNKRE